MSTEDFDAISPSAPVLRRWAGPLASTALVCAWSALVLWRPSTTFHLAPFLVAAAWPYATRAASGQQLDRSTAVRAASFGAAMTLTVSTVLWLAHRLDGPSLWSSSGAPLEVVLITALGATWGAWVAARRQAGWLFGGQSAAEGSPEARPDR